MGEAKRIELKPISRQDADKIVKALHYSGKVVNNSRVHLGAFYRGRCMGAMQFGPPTDYSKALRAFPSLTKRDVIELNRMAFSDALPRNGESRCIAVAARMMKARSVELIQSYADATQSGDGAIYRASGFRLVSVRTNRTMWRLPDGEVVADMLFSPSCNSAKQAAARRRLGMPTEAKTQVLQALGAERLSGCQLRYVLPLTARAAAAIILPEIPYSEARKVRMYRGKRLASRDSAAPADQAGEGGAIPTAGLQHSDSG